jgi:hypothetical protein
MNPIDFKLIGVSLMPSKDNKKNNPNNKEDLLKQTQAILSKFDSNVSTPETIEGDGDADAFFEGDGHIPTIEEIEFGDLGEGLEEAIVDSDNKKQERLGAMKQRAAKKRKATNTAKKKSGVRPGKQSKHSTRSDTFLADNNESLPALHIVLATEHQSEIYKDGADICPRLKKGSAHFGKACKRNAFELLKEAQDKIKEQRGDNPEHIPWIIISNDTSMITDRKIVSRLSKLRENTVIAAPYGFSKVRTSGRWFDVTEADQPTIRGCYTQGMLDGDKNDFIVGHRYKQSDRYRILIAHGPFIAVRGEMFMKLDFKDAAKNYTRGFHHYMADISMQVVKLGNHQLAAASIQTLAIQEDTHLNHLPTDEFELDQRYFASRWQEQLPNATPELQRPQQR